LFKRCSARPPYTQLTKLLLQTLPVQPDRRRSSRDVPSMLCELSAQVGHFEFPFGLTKIPFANSVVVLIATMFNGDRLAMHHLAGQIFDANFVATREHHAALQRIL